MLVNRVLENISSPVNDSSVICKPCYDFQSSFLKAIQKLQVVTTICYKLLKTSVDKYIASLLKMRLRALNKTVLNVATEIKCNHALLMKRVYNQFLHTVKTRCKVCVITNQMNLPSIRWVLAQIVIKLAPHVSFVCKVKREGTILYRSNGDIMHALSHSLAENKNHDCFTNVTNVLNNLLHEQAKGFLKRYKGHPETSSEMSLDNDVASIHPVF